VQIRVCLLSLLAVTLSVSVVVGRMTCRRKTVQRFEVRLCPGTSAFGLISNSSSNTANNTNGGDDHGGGSVCLYAVDRDRLRWS
jgi:hypothetical protein